MVQFNRKTASGHGGIGHHLKNARRSLGLTVDEIVEATKIRKPLILALEQSAFHKIEEPFYRTLILKTYSEYVGLDWCAVQSEYERESAYISSCAPSRSSVRTPEIQRSELWVTSRIAKNIFLACAMLGAGIYLAFLAVVAFRPPVLIVQEPSNNIESSSHTVRVRGTVSNESDVRINGQRVLKKGDGSFEQEVTLSGGTNVIHVAAAKKYSKESVVTRTVVYQEPVLPNP
ncbi:MAG: helix-turn-helix domain-containing protein [Candidatus Uhrbacteria bacterium]|nr:helix-turn-helix domain-containing protein [Candidatus Uhrbacteria bacterium]